MQLIPHSRTTILWSRLALLAVVLLAVVPRVAQGNIGANEAASLLDTLQVEYANAVDSGSTAPELERIAGELVTLESIIDMAGLTHSLIEIVDRSRYQRAWCCFRIGELSGATGTLQKAAVLFDSLRTDGTDDDVVEFSRYMSGEARFWQGLLAKWKAMLVPTFQQEDMGTAMASFASSSDRFASISADTTALESLRLAASMRLGDVRYEIGKVRSAVDDSVGAANSLDSCRYRDRELLRSIRTGPLSGLTAYGDAMCRMWKGSYDAGIDASSDVSISGSPFEFAGEARFREANLLHRRALEDSTLWPVVDSLYGAAARIEGIPEGLYWQGLVRTLRAEQGADSLFREFLDSPFNENDSRIGALRDDARRRIDLETGKITVDNVREFLRPGTDQYLVDQAVANARYLIRRAASKIDHYLRRPYLEKANAFLDFVAKQMNEGSLSDSLTLRHEIGFYKAIVRYLGVRKFENALRQAREYVNVAQDMASIACDFEAEAQYVRAICLFDAWAVYCYYGNEEDSLAAENMLAQARTTLEDLIEQKKSVRSLFQLARMLHEAYESETLAKSCFLTVIEKTRDCEQLRFLKAECEASISQMGDEIEDTQVQTDGSYDQVICPDYLVTESDVFWEGLAHNKGAMAVFARESWSLLQQYALPKKSLFTTDRTLDRSVVLQDCIVPGTGAKPLSAHVPDVLRLEPVWDLEVLLLREDGERAVGDDRIRVAQLGEAVLSHRLGNSRFVLTDIPLGENVCLQTSLADDSGGYYPERKCYLSSDLRGWRVVDTIVLAATTGSYVQVDSPGDSTVRCLSRSRDRNILVYRPSLCPSGSAQVGFEDDLRIRDLVILNDSVALGVHAAGKIVAYSASPSKPAEARDWARGLSSPEGLAVDARRQVYVADFGGDRIVVFDSTGTELRTFGSTGYNRQALSLDSTRLELPTRLAIEHDEQGLTYNGAIVRRSDHLLVADRAGVHRLDMFGNYLDSPLQTRSDWPTPGDLYGFEITGYGVDSRLIVADRGADGLVCFVPTKVASR